MIFKRLKLEELYTDKMLLLLPPLKFLRLLKLTKVHYSASVLKVNHHYRRDYGDDNLRGTLFC